ncbi:MULTISPECIES: methylenetetrahydrofolate reductase [unclassified Arthrobacter]|uniref:methylenetetrahydrofolate reductase n=1 Tax=unclassified Arthrobacter TaxID=235627 RepID=UPI00149299D5|nr:MULTISPECIES: methylenetetrahydrofolate reductase [unclassified Arthrobacter]MBE0008524.1 methylenetetrahydrofolate reductase [Arthrobacter sp. AET 35A]NOJ62264.1 methylenetetrahydrofolate reductase [Arthrobacter sp. 147(2020)]
MADDPGSLPLRVEIIPAPGIVEALREHLPAPAVVTITCLAHHGAEETIDLAVRLADLGYRAVPHLAARSLKSRGQLAGFLTRLQTAGVSDIFVIAGDGEEAAGSYAWSGALMADIASLGGGWFSLGTAAYPEGRPGTSSSELTDLLLAKQDLCSWAVTQLCFSGPVLSTYLTELRAAGVWLPVWAGVPGAVRRTRLISLAARIGVGPSLRFAQRSLTGAGGGSLVRSVLAPSSYDPAPLIRSVVDSGWFAGLHVYSFNDVQSVARTFGADA